jgi:transposase
MQNIQNMQNIEKLIIGVDVSKKDLDVAFWQSHPESKSIFLGKFSNDSQGFQTIAMEVEKRQQESNSISVFLVLEPTGGYEQRFAHFAHELGWEVSLPNPKQVRDWIRGTGRRAKTDRIDALMLAYYGVMQNPYTWKPVSPEVAQLESMLDRFEDLKGMLAQEKNRLEAQQNRVNCHHIASENLQENIAHLEQQVKALEKAVKEYMNHHPHLKEQCKNLKTVSGVGDRLGPRLLIAMHRFGELTDFKGTRKAITAFFGLDPKPHESGTSIRKRAGISRQGNTEIRHFLYMGALGGVGGNNPLRSFYKGLVGRGKPKKLALVAAARKILVWCWAVFRQGKPFDATRHQYVC